MKPRKMYLDIDGVLVVWDSVHNCVELATGFGRLMRFCKIHDIQPYWLSFWNKRPETLEGLNCLLWPRTAPTMAVPQIIPYAGGGKLDMIDYESDFTWIEDGLSQDDLAVLAKRGVADRFFWTNGLDPECLIKFMEFTRIRMGLTGVDDWGPHWESTWTHPRVRGEQKRVPPSSLGA